MNTPHIFVMVAIAIGGVAWVFIYPLLSGERNAERRMASVTRKEPMQQQRAPRAGRKSRREQVEGSLKQLEARQKASKRVPLSLRLAQAGLSWTPRRFMVISISLGFVVFVVLMLTGIGLLPSQRRSRHAIGRACGGIYADHRRAVLFARSPAGLRQSCATGRPGRCEGGLSRLAAGGIRRYHDAGAGAGEPRHAHVGSGKESCRFRRSSPCR